MKTKVIFPKNCINSYKLSKAKRKSLENSKDFILLLFPTMKAKNFLKESQNLDIMQKRYMGEEYIEHEVIIGWIEVYEVISYPRRQDIGGEEAVF